jgi:hypothetical protein
MRRIRLYPWRVGISMLKALLVGLVLPWAIGSSGVLVTASTHVGALSLVGRGHGTR